MATNGKPLTTGMIELPMQTDLWSLIEKNLVRQQTIDGLIPLSTGSKAKIKLVIEKVYSPESLRAIQSENGTISTNMSLDEASGMSRAHTYIINFLMTTAWFLVGYTTSGEKKVSICVIVIPNIGYASYSFKGEEETMNKFMNPSLN